MNDNNALHGAPDLTNCDREPIRTPGTVQSYGALCVMDVNDAMIWQVGVNADVLLGSAPAALLGAPLESVLGADQVARLKMLIDGRDITRPIHLLNFCSPVEGCALDLSVHRSDGRLILEFEAADTVDPYASDPLALVQAMVTRINDSTTLEQYCQAATEQVREVTGYDRVMVYRFLPDGCGWVYAESAAPGVETFRGLRYPASDIPQQARALYLENWLRIVVDVSDPGVPILAGPDGVAGELLDLGHATLRSVSPIHLEYLRNMGVGATMTISIIKDGSLWGLIACHHLKPKRLPRHLRAVCELFGNMFAFQLDARERSETLEYRHRSSTTHAGLVTRMVSHEDLGEGLMHEQPSLLDYIDADGVAVIADGRYHAMGRTPRESQVRALVAWLDEQDHRGVFATDSLARHYDLGRDFAMHASGVLAITASKKSSDYVLWFRPEMIETVRWAGDPSKPVESGPLGDRLTPRKSFEAWAESVRMQSKPWTTGEVEAAASLRLSLLEVVLKRIDQLAFERGIAQDRHEVMLAELNHRVKNVLATIRALAKYSEKSAGTLEAYVLNFNRRIQAMASSHDLLSQASWQSVDLDSLVRSQLAPYINQGNVEVSGPKVDIQAHAAAPIGMVLHELATNAAKYGALSNNAQVAVGWSFTGSGNDRKLAITWCESGGPKVVPPTRQGFGTFTLEKIIPFQCNGRTEIRYLADGVECEIEVGSECFGDALADVRSADLSKSATDQKASRILIVEDEAILAFMLTDVVLAMGYEPIGPINRVGAALVVAREEPMKAAILDVNLAGERSWDIAQILSQRGIPFVFTTGYDMEFVRAAGFGDRPILSKPFEPEDVTAALNAILHIEALSPA